MRWDAVFHMLSRSFVFFSCFVYRDEKRRRKFPGQKILQENCGESQLASFRSSDIKKRAFHTKKRTRREKMFFSKRLNNIKCLWSHIRFSNGVLLHPHPVKIRENFSLFTWVQNFYRFTLIKDKKFIRPFLLAAEEHRFTLVDLEWTVHHFSHPIRGKNKLIKFALFFIDS